MAKRLCNSSGNKYSSTVWEEPTTSGDWKLFLNFFFDDEAQAVVESVDVEGVLG